MTKTLRLINDNFLVFSKRLRELRESLNLTQSEFSEMTGFTQATLSAYENSLKVPSLDIVMNIATKCKVSIDWLCGLTDIKMLNNRPNTYSDLLQMIISISESVELYMDTIECTDQYIDGNTGYPEFISINYRCLYFKDDIIGKFLCEWDKIKKLHEQKTIDDDIYNIWIERECNKYKDYLLFNAKISEDLPPEDIEESQQS